MVTHIYGDSHAHSFAAVPQVKVNWLGPITMWRVGRDSSLPLFQGLSTGDNAVYIFGEIDVRCHLLKFGRSTQQAINALAQLYLNRILTNCSDDICAWVCGCVPPTNQHLNPEYPITGAIDERVSVTLSLNATLINLCAGTKATYIDMYTPFALEDGTLNPAVSDGTVHIAKEFITLVRNVPWLT